MRGSRQAAHAAGAHKAFTSDNDLLAADERLGHISALLPELFCLRSIGDGFAMLVSAIHCALVNNIEAPVSLDKTWAIKKALSKLQAEPFMDVSIAIDQIESLQDAGFITVPTALDKIGEALSE